MINGNNISSFRKTNSLIPIQNDLIKNNQIKTELNKNKLKNSRISKRRKEDNMNVERIDQHGGYYSEKERKVTPENSREVKIYYHHDQR